MEYQNKYLMQQILDAAQSVTYDNLDDAKESLRNALETIEAKEEIISNRNVRELAGLPDRGMQHEANN